MDPTLIAAVEIWIARDPDPQTRAELSELLAARQQDALQSRFSKRLQFGTAGLRGVLGAGPARMNRLVVRESSAGFGAYLIQNVPEARCRGVVVGYDARYGSRQFAEDAAGVFAGLGLSVHLFESICPTPLCAFALRQIEAAGAVMVTASHNPPEYNGYKVYWHNGAQIIPPHDKGIAAAIAAASQGGIACLSIADIRRAGLLHDLGAPLFEAYLQAVARVCWTAGPTDRPRSALRVAYTPLHGVGAALTEAALQATGLCDVATVATQRAPDADFPTVAFPNPEEPGAMDAVLTLARTCNADLAVAHDPDADRLCIAVPNETGDFDVLTGDQLGVLLGNDLVERAGGHGFVATTVVSSTLLQAVAQAHGCRCLETLTGFKWLANRSIEEERASGERFVFAYEEALGYCVGGLVWDKDGISALIAVARLAAELKAQGRSLRDQLDAIYARHGVCLTRQCSTTLPPQSVHVTVGDQLRRQRITCMAGRNVRATTDLQQRTRTTANGETTPVALPSSDVLIYELDGQARVIIRPSGTEPKLKCYYEICTPVPTPGSCRDAQQQARAALNALIAMHQRELQERQNKSDFR